MKSIPESVSRPALAVLALSCAATLALAQPPSRGSQKTPPAATRPVASDPAADSTMAQMQRLGTPGPRHEALRAMEGTWKAAVKVHGPNGELNASEGTSVNRMILGGRFLEQRFTSTMMNQPLEGYGLIGYDNATRRYTLVWVDNGSTSMLLGNGDMDDAAKTLTISAVASGPDGQPMNLRLITKMVDANTQVFSIYGPLGSNPSALMMEITYTRS